MKIGQARPPHEGFRMVPDRMLFDMTLQPLDVRLWGVLLFLARGRDATDATDATLAGKLGVSDRTVRRALDRLEGAEYISRRRAGDARVITFRPEGRGGPPAAFGLKVCG